MKRKILKAMGLLLTAGMLAGPAGMAMARANGLKNVQDISEAEDETEQESGSGTGSAEGDASEPVDLDDITVDLNKPDDTESGIDASEGTDSADNTETQEPDKKEDADTSVTPKPGQDSAKPSEAPKPGQDSAKPSATPEPGQDSAKPSATPEPGQDSAKPSATPEPGQNSAKPSEAPKPSPEGVKPSESSKPAASDKGDAGKPATTSPAPGSTDVVLNGWVEEEGKFYWYEEGVKQGTEGNGTEVYDPDSEAWYWLNPNDNGARVANSDVYLESDGGKWVHYGADGRMVKGEYTREGESYFYDSVTGELRKGPVVLADGRKVFYDLETGKMVKGDYELNGQTYHFDETDGHLTEEPKEEQFWLTLADGTYWYVNWERQGWKPEDTDYQGEEIYDPAQDAWFWLDGTQKGSMAADKLIYRESQEESEGEPEEGASGNWFYYGTDGKRLQGWSEDGMYYFDPENGAMARGIVVIGNIEYEFDAETGAKISEKFISGFELYGLECNVESGVEYDYLTGTSEYDIPVLGTAVFDYKVFDSDDTHSAREGYEWKQVTISMRYDQKRVKQFGCEYALLGGLDYYTFQNDSLVQSSEEEELERQRVVTIDDVEYDIATHYEVLRNEWGEDGVAYVTVCYEAQLPAGYDGMVVALYNTLNESKGETVLDKLDRASLIFQMK